MGVYRLIAVASPLFGKWVGNRCANSPLQMVFLKLVHTESQVNHKTQPFWVKVVHQVPNVQTNDVGAIRLAPTTTLHFDTVLKTKY